MLLKYFFFSKHSTNQIKRRRMVNQVEKNLHISILSCPLSLLVRENANDTPFHAGFTCEQSNLIFLVKCKRKIIQNKLSNAKTNHSSNQISPFFYKIISTH